LEPPALAGLEIAGVFSRWDLPSVARYFHFTLQSPRQPEVMRLTCRGALDDWPFVAWPTLWEIRGALEPIADLEL
jgi:hypothetical protein